MIPELLHRIDRCPLSIFTLQSAVRRPPAICNRALSRKPPMKQKNTQNQAIQTAGGMVKKIVEDDGAKPDEGEWQLADNHAFFLFLRYERRDCFQILSGAGRTAAGADGRPRTAVCGMERQDQRHLAQGHGLAVPAPRPALAGASPTVRQPLPMTPTHHPHISRIRPQHIFWTPAAEEDSRASRWPLPCRSAGSLCATRLPRR